MNASPFPVGLRWGLIGGLISIIFGYVNQMIMLNLASGNLILFGLYSLLVIAITIGIYIFIIRSAIIRQREDHLDGLISFGQAFTVAIVAVVVMAIISLIFNYVFTTFLDPNYAERLSRAVIDTMENMGAPADQIEAARERMKDQQSFSSQMKTGLIWSLGPGIIVSLIAASILKKDVAVEE